MDQHGRALMTSHSATSEAETCDSTKQFRVMSLFIKSFGSYLDIVEIHKTNINKRIKGKIKLLMCYCSVAKGDSF